MIIATFFLINDLNAWHLEEIHGYGQTVYHRFSRGFDFRIGNSLDDFKYMSSFSMCRNIFMNRSVPKVDALADF